MQQTCKYALAPVLLALGLLFLCVKDADAQFSRLRTVEIGPPRQVVTSQGVRLQPTQAVADRLIVRMRPQSPRPTISKAAMHVSGRVSRSLEHDMYVVELPEGSDLRDAAARIRTQSGVLFVEPDQIVHPALVPNDPLYSQQYYLAMIQAARAWDVTTGSANVIIAVVDTGVQLSHPEFKGKIWVNPGEIANTGRDDDGNGFIDDINGWDFYEGNNDPNPRPDGKDNDNSGIPDEQVAHGTLVAGLAAALGNNNFGTAGVSWGATIMPVKVFPDDGGTAVSTVVEGINYAVNNGAHIINLSIGGDFAEAFSAPIIAARNAGIVVVSAGGNSGRSLTDARSTWESPVCNDGPNPLVDNYVIGVAATDRNDRRASYSNYDSSSGSFIDVAAPGDELLGPTPYFPAFPAFKEHFGTNTGTSFSAPLVSGLAALILSVRPNATPAQVIEIIKNSCDNIDALNPGYAGKLGAGRINLARALGVRLPPAAVVDLRAEDTPGDSGGSITLTWRKSADDGSGANSVTGYTILRRGGSQAALKVVAELPKGTERYVDNATVDGVDYYYVVRVTDGTLSSDSAEVGPVQSKNDAPPPVITGLRAVDRPSDSGGAIILTWDAYTAPDDFKQFVIYRATRDFASTVGITVLKVITDKTVRQYTDTTTVDGVDYYYAVGVRDTAGNENTDLRAAGPVQSYPNGPVNFAPGLHFLGVPAVPQNTDPAAVFGGGSSTIKAARWNPSTGRYVQYPSSGTLPPLLRLDLGRGFWIHLDQATVVRPEGQSAPAGDFDIDLPPGWHMLANPYFGAVNFADATVTYGGVTMDLASADAAGIIEAFAWVYDNQKAQYTLAYPDIGEGVKLIAPWRGFWVRVEKQCRLTISRPQDAAASSRTASAARIEVPKVLWSLRVEAAGAAGSDRNTVLGMATRALNISKPPPVSAGPQIFAAGSGQQVTEGTAAISLVEHSAAGAVWPLAVRNLRAGETVRIATPDLSQVPAEFAVMLEDPATSTIVSLRTSSGYVFTPAAGETERRLVLRVEPRSSGNLNLHGINTQVVRGGGAQVMFTLSAPADCSVRILNIAGRPIKIIEEGKLRPAGNNTVLWDGRNSGGAPVPSGLYLVEVMARGEAGESVRGMGTMRLER